MEKIRWGIVGTGYISNQFADSFRFVRGGDISAVASRNFSGAAEFARKYNVSKAYGSYEEMAEDKEIDIVYVGTPHTTHLEIVLMFLNAGHNVLCEKPLGVNEKQARAMVDAARQKNRFLMEGMWSRFFSGDETERCMGKRRRVGTPTMLSANLGIRSGEDRSGWRFNRAMAGGALLDVGIYTLSAASSIFGLEPEEILTAACLQDGVDDYNSSILKYKGGQMAALGSALSVKMDNKLVLSGSEGCLVLGKGADWFRPDQAAVYTGGDAFAFTEKAEFFSCPYESTGFQYEAEGVCDAIRAGLVEAPEFGWDESIKTARTMDLLRSKWGVVYAEDL